MNKNEIGKALKYFLTQLDKKFFWPNFTALSRETVSPRLHFREQIVYSRYLIFVPCPWFNPLQKLPTKILKTTLPFKLRSDIYIYIYITYIWLRVAYSNTTRRVFMFGVANSSTKTVSKSTHHSMMKRLWQHLVMISLWSCRV